MIRTYKDLDVYQRSYRLAVEMHQIALKLPQHEQYGLSDQIRRAALSIPLNIAEGYGRSSAEFKRFLRISLGSCNEVRVLIDFLSDLKYIDTDVYNRLLEEYEALARQLYKLEANWRSL